MQTGIIRAVCISEKRGTPKINVQQATLIKNFGVQNDAHGAPGIREVSLLGVESIEKMHQQGIEVPYGGFGENLTTEGILLYKLPLGTFLQVGPTLLEVTQIGKECHSPCAIGQATGKCVMPEEGVFARVLKGGHVRVGDQIRIIKRNSA